MAHGRISAWLVAGWIVVAGAGCGNAPMTRGVRLFNGPRVDAPPGRVTLNDERLKLTLEPVMGEELNDALAMVNRNLAYDSAFRFPPISVYRLKAENTGPEAVYFNHRNLVFRPDNPQASEIRLVLPLRFQIQFDSLAYSSLEYEKLFISRVFDRAGRQLNTPPAAPVAEEIPGGLSPEERRARRVRRPPYAERLADFIIPPGGRSERLLCLPHFSPLARWYDLRTEYRLVPQPESIQRLEARLEYIDRREPPPPASGVFPEIFDRR